VVAGAGEELERLRSAGIDVLMIGSAGGDRIAIAAAEAEFEVALDDAARAWRSLGERLERSALV
jgi:hypothetical protein